MTAVKERGPRSRPNASGKLDDHTLKLKSKYASHLVTLKTLFVDWNEEDLIATLEEAAGDLDLVISRISEGRIIFFFFLLCECNVILNVYLTNILHLQHRSCRTMVCRHKKSR